MSTTGYIFGGPDRSGKTTIAKALAETIGAQYYKNDNQREFFEKRPNEFKLLTEYQAPSFVHFLENVTIPGGVVIDRFTPCEFAYSAAYERETNVPLIMDVDWRLSKLGFIFVFCFKSEYPEWDDDLVAKEKVPSLIHNYLRYAQITSMQFVILNTTSQNLQSQLNTILQKRVYVANGGK